MKHVSKSLGDTTADLVRTSPFYIQEVGWAVIHRHTLKQRRAWMTKWQTSNALVKSQFSLYSFLWYHYIWHWYHIMNIFYHVIKHFLVDLLQPFVKTLIKTFRVDLHGTYHFNEISICFEMHINIYCYECCHWIGSLFLLFWKTHMYQKCMFCCYTRFEHMMCVY